MATRGNFLPDDDDEKQINAPTMGRSRNQLASSYAPGSFFTFEGGLGACIALPDSTIPYDEAPIDDQTKDQIVLRLHEVWQSWFSRASALNSPEHPIDERLCIDGALLRGKSLSPLSRQQLAFVNPVRMGYAPAPLTFVCNTCNLFRSFSSTAEAASNQASFKRFNCANPGKKGNCKWRQLDVIFVHWSGEWMPATPGMWEWSDKEGRARLFGERCNCGSTDYYLHTQSPRIGEWYFQCANPNCGERRRATWLQNDRFTTEVLSKDAGKRISERRMEPISYRASSAFYAQAEQFVVFAKEDQGLLALLRDDKREALADFIAKKYGYGGLVPSNDEIRDILLRAGQDKEWGTFELFESMALDAEARGDTSAATRMREEQQNLINRWRTAEPPLLPVKGELPGSISRLLASRAEFSSRYDPFVLAVEHEALKLSKLSRSTESGRAAFVRFNHLDNDLAPKDEAAKARQEQQSKRLMAKLGMAEAGLVREFELCRFTHGYTRVSPTPIMDKRGQRVPVRLRLFEALRTSQRPVYVVTQQNEALYVQLDHKDVYKWLQAVGVKDLPEWDFGDEPVLGGRLLEVAHPFGRYFSGLKPADASTYRYVYTLLHTYAHVVMSNVAELSGLDLGSLGEYIFPADLAFVVYRNGTTMDLGNLSSLWRNENNAFLEGLLEPKSHQCNSGSLCDFGGGACPDCIVIPETSCIAQNRLLSRAVLKGGVAPREDKTHENQRIVGFLELINGPS